MAKGKRMGRAARRRWLGGTLLLAVLLGASGWWAAGEWRPDRRRFPVQGILAGAGDGPVNWTAARASGADFAYLRASAGASRRDSAFAANLAEAREAALQVGALHRYNPCQGAGPQAGNFVTTVPRDSTMLPPAVELTLDEDECAAPPAQAAMESELTTFLNQIEAHSGKPAILKLSRGFEDRYGLAAMIDRNLWVSGSYLAPGYAGRPWVLWTANARLRSPAADGRLRWVVVRP